MINKNINKHVVIAGTPRAGKTTLCLELLKYGFLHYRMDSVKRGMCEAFDCDQHDWDAIMPKMAKIVETIFKEYKTDTVYLKEFYAIDTCHLLPKDTISFKNDVLIIFLGYADIDVNDKIEEIRLHDKEYYWSSKVSDDVLNRMIKANINLSKKIREECQKYNIKYFDTSFNRDEVLREILDFILKECT